MSTVWCVDDLPIVNMNNVIEHHFPNHPQFAMEERRLATFKDWPPGMPIKPHDLARAGFYYLGKILKL